jgi:DNA adenine methylase
MSDNLIAHLSALYEEVADNFNEAIPIVSDARARAMTEEICRSIKNRGVIRFLMSCLVAKIDNPSVDVRKPYTKIGGKDTFSGRHYDERPVQEIINKFNLPTNPTTAYLTPAFRNRNATMTPDLNLVGRPPELYQHALDLLDLVYQEVLGPEELLKEIFRQLIIFRETNERRINELIAALRTTKDAQPLSSEQIVTLIRQHLDCPNSSRLPTLILAAAYKAVGGMIGEAARPLHSHNAADSQTGAYGDVEVTLINDENIVTCYEMKDKKVTRNDITIALQKIAQIGNSLDNYVFITTDTIDPVVQEYAHDLYEEAGVEFIILDCVGFLRHFLHFFHRSRTEFLNAYQVLVLTEPNSSVGQPLKEAFLALRTAAEAG